MQYRTTHDYTQKKKKEKKILLKKTLAINSIKFSVEHEVSIRVIEDPDYQGLPGYHQLH